MERNVPQEIRGERERSEAREDEVVNECVESLQAVEQSQLLQVQVVVFSHLSLQELAAKVHHSAHLNDHRQGLFTLYFTFRNTFNTRDTHSFLPAEGGQLQAHSQCCLHPVVALHCTGSPLQHSAQCRTSQLVPPADRTSTMEVNLESDI